ncbi:MAG: Bro-N domain-containing protein [Clostridium fessum]
MNQYGDAGEQVVEISFITEGDVYRLIVHSKLPSAERFEHWVFDEVLPSIRKAWCVYERFHFGSGDSASGGHLHPGAGACSRERAA